MKKRIMTILLALALILGSAQAVYAEDQSVGGPAVTDGVSNPENTGEKIILKNYPDAGNEPIYIQGKEGRLYYINASASYENKSLGLISDYCWEIKNGDRYEEVLSGAGASMFGNTLKKDTFLRLTITGSEGSVRTVYFAVLITEIPASLHEHIFGPSVVTIEADCTREGIMTAVCECGEKKLSVISQKEHEYTEEKIPASPTKTGIHRIICKNCKDVKTEEVIASPARLKLSTDAFIYTGKAQKPVVTVIDENGEELKTSSYTVTYPSGRIGVGKYTVTVNFKGDYTGSLKTAFTIVPKGTSITSLTRGSKRFTVKWSKKTTQTTGYQIRYADNPAFTGAKTVTVSGYKKTSKTLTKLKAKKKYYVQIRTYKTVSGVKYYSGWSFPRSVTTKK